MFFAVMDSSIFHEAVPLMWIRPPSHYIFVFRDSSLVLLWIRPPFYVRLLGVIASTFVSDRLPRPPLIMFAFYSYFFSWYFSYAVKGFVPCFIVDSSTFLC